MNRRDILGAIADLGLAGKGRAQAGGTEIPAGRWGARYLDLLQFHENIRFDDPDRFFAPGGAAQR